MATKTKQYRDVTRCLAIARAIANDEDVTDAAKEELVTLLEQIDARTGRRDPSVRAKKRPAKRAAKKPAKKARARTRR